MKLKRVLLLVGSPRPNRSNSESLGNYLLEGLTGNGARSETLHLRNAFQSQAKIGELLKAIDRNDLVILSTPLYVDSLPSIVIKTMETVYKERKEGKEPKKFLVVINCGFPESRHNNTAIRICGKFAQQMGYQWLGGLSLGGGEAINKKEVKAAGGLVRNVIKSLDLTIEALSNDRDIPAEAFNLMARPLVPIWLFRFLGTFGWKRQAKKHGVEKQLAARPYQ